ncbi:MAG: signal recognition particle subunit SRP19/SEC65 family protein [Candidatus Heimdallarchaeota archaeon]
MRRDRTHYFIYPEYFDKSLTRKEGRRLSKAEALDNPTLDEIRLAADKLGYKREDPNRNAAYPRRWWDKNGLILVEKKEPKLITLRKLSVGIKEFSRPYIEKKKKELAEEKKFRKEKRKHVKTSPRRKKADTETEDDRKPQDFRPKRRR